MLTQQSFSEKPILNPYYKQLVKKIIAKYGYRIKVTQNEISKQLKVRSGAIFLIFQTLQANDLLTYEYINGTRKIYCISQDIIKHL